MLEGHNSREEKIWHEWGAPARNSPWGFVLSWFDGHKARECLPEVFNGFNNLIQDPNWTETIPKAIYWYILSNTLVNKDGGLIIAQTILELLAWNYLVIDKGILSQETFSRINASEQFKLMLALMGIPLLIPDGLKDLTKFAKSNNYDGLEALTNLRNSLVHPGKRAKSLRASSQLIFEAHNLAMWYVELVLLRLCNFVGDYASRVLGRARWAGEVQSVPWKTQESE